MSKTKTGSLAQRFLSRVDRSGDCWIWMGCKDCDGYGKLMIDTKPLLAHRASYLIFRGEVAAGLFVCHRCDTPSCVNPDHLFLGTPQLGVPSE